MIIPQVFPRRAFPVADRTREGDPYRLMHPRLAAIDLLREKIADRQAGLDPFDPGVFILEARPDETVWANRALSLTGFVLPGSAPHPRGGIRFRAAVADDVRAELGLDSANPPLMEDEPLASRGYETLTHTCRADDQDALLRVFHPDQLIEADPEPVSIMRPALDRAARLAALRVDCGCGATAYQPCGCTVGDRLASAAANGNEVH